MTGIIIISDGYYYQWRVLLLLVTGIIINDGYYYY